jgi:hypothetical protein
MRLQIILLGFLISFINSIALAQKVRKKELIGEWHLVKLKLDSTVIVDINNVENLKEKNLGILRKSKPDYTKEDSLREMEHVDESVAEIRKIFFRFNKDNTYSNTKIERKGIITSEVEHGSYKLLTKKASIILTDSKGVQSDFAIKLNKEIVSMRVTSGGKTVSMELKK